MTYRGVVKNGQIHLTEPLLLPEGVEVSVEVLPPRDKITSPAERRPLQRVTPIELSGGPLSDELVRDRR